MPDSNLLYTLLIGPLEVLFEAVYTLSYRLCANPGFAIVGMSLVMNLLLLPLYRRTDDIQLEAMQTEKRMRPTCDHIKKVFRGPEQFLILQTWYRQNHYKPTDSLKGLTPLMLEIPFFMAAYHFLSHLELLQGAALGPIGDLGAPDGLLVIGTYTFNALPVLMTGINILSSLIYTKDAPLRTKLQLYLMAALFLVLLYDSPAGLVFYWTLNNLFSLVKNLLMELGKKFHSVKAPRKESETVSHRENHLSFLLGSSILAVLIGALIPAALIHTSPEEFLVIGSGIDPLSYIRYTAVTAAGFFVLWMGLFYGLAKPKIRKGMETAVWVLCAASVTDYMWFGKDYGILSSRLTYETALSVTAGEIGINLLVLAAVCGAVLLIRKKKPALLRLTGMACVLAMIGMSAVNVVQSRRVISEKMAQMEAPPAQVEPLFRLSTEGRNVVILMLDRGVSDLVPYLMAEKPQLQRQFDGFTYYPNTLSFGSHTNVGLPSVLGGYEYTPLEMNRRSEETLEQKHNEALKVMPTMFHRAGFTATLCDPTYAGYDWIPDLSVFDDCPEIGVHITMGHYNGQDGQAEMESPARMQHKFLYYSLFKAAPVFLHEVLYDDGTYQSISGEQKEIKDSTVYSYGISEEFRNSYNVLRNLRGLTRITEGEEDTFLLMCNETTHSPQLLQLPEYEPLMYVDNTPFDSTKPTRTDAEGNRIAMQDTRQVQHYHCNMAAFLQIGNWFDYLRENGVYDNTRIILVSDHGYFLHLHEDWEFGSGWDEDIMYYNPLLMIKDFGSTGAMQTDGTFMTNADVPALAAAGLIENPVNPFTGKSISTDPKQERPLYLLHSHQWDVSRNRGTTYAKDPWLAVSGDVRDPQGWTYIDETELPGGKS